MGSLAKRHTSRLEVSIALATELQGCAVRDLEHADTLEIRGQFTPHQLRCRAHARGWTSTCHSGPLGLRRRHLLKRGLVLPTHAAQGRQGYGNIPWTAPAILDARLGTTVTGSDVAQNMPVHHGAMVRHQKV